jgi:hypothetical protein
LNVTNHNLTQSSHDFTLNLFIKCCIVLKSKCLLVLTNVLLSISEYSYLSIGIGMRLAASGVQLAVGKHKFILPVLSKPPLWPTEPRVMGNWSRFLQGESDRGNRLSSHIHLSTCKRPIIPLLWTSLFYRA